jgi:hypothetical protein
MGVKTMRYLLLALSLCYAGALYAASTEVPLAHGKDNTTAPVTLDIPKEKKQPLLQPFVTDKGERAELVTPFEDEDYEYAIIPIKDEHPDPLDNSGERNTDSVWDLLSW